MTIAALPQSTIRLLGSTTNIGSPVDVVKELIDNAIDASARFIEVSISPNTLDRIQVRDNGHGIALADFDALARVAHTSKLRTFDELQTRGGQTLGFRGQALASANAIANVTVITKTNRDPVASKVQLRRGIGGIGERHTASAPVGTTVVVTSLFEELPARKQNLLKHIPKTIDSIKSLIMTYVFARRGKLQFKYKVLGCAEPKCVYVPSPDATISDKLRMRDVIMQLFSKNLANGCIYEELGQSNQRDEGGFILTAILPSLKSDTAVWLGKGAFVSVDARPLSTLCGTAKKIYAMFKIYLCKGLNLTKAPAKPFLFMDIQCMPDAYDVNVATLKNDVLFSEEAVLLDHVRALFDKAYGNDSETMVTEKRDVETSPENTNRTMQEAQLPTQLPTHATLDAVRLKTPCRTNVTPDTSSNKSVNACEDSDIRFDPVEQCSSAWMRTKVVVNMERQDSNVTDDGADHVIQVVVPKRLDATANREEFPQKKPRLTDAARKFLGIERYLLPQNADFEIATDDTATPEHSMETSENMNRNRMISRPLQSLTQPQINRLNGQYESDPESETSNDSVTHPSRQLTPRPTQQRDRAVSIESIRERNDRPMEDGADVIARIGSAGFTNLQTPPPSVPMRPQLGITSRQQPLSSPAPSQQRVTRGLIPTGSQRRGQVRIGGIDQRQVRSSAMAVSSNYHGIAQDGIAKAQSDNVGSSIAENPVID